MRLLDADPLLLAVVFTLFVVSCYAVWLWLNLWLTHQILDRTAVITTVRATDASSPGCGLAGLLFLITVLVCVAGFLLTGR